MSCALRGEARSPELGDLPCAAECSLLPPRSARLERDEARGGPGDRTALIRPFDTGIRCVRGRITSCP